MKKILLGLIFIFTLSVVNLGFATNNCNYSEWGTISSNLENCLSDSSLVKWTDAQISSWFRNYITKWTNNISLFLWVLAVTWIAIGAFMLTTSAGESDKVSKAKSIIQWSVVWFIWVLTAALIINLIVRIMYSGTLNNNVRGTTTSIVILWK